jgi:hypothetical protein
MLRYLEQLGELYWWKYAGLIVVMFVLLALGFGTVALQFFMNVDKFILGKLLRRK